MGNIPISPSYDDKVGNEDGWGEGRSRGHKSHHVEYNPKKDIAVLPIKSSTAFSPTYKSVPPPANTTRVPAKLQLKKLTAGRRAIGRRQSVGYGREPARGFVCLVSLTVHHDWLLD